MQIAPASTLWAKQKARQQRANKRGAQTVLSILVHVLLPELEHAHPLPPRARDAACLQRNSPNPVRIKRHYIRFWGKVKHFCAQYSPHESRIAITARFVHSHLGVW